MAIESVAAIRVVTDEGELLIARRYCSDGIDLQLTSCGGATVLTLTWEQVDGIFHAATALRGVPPPSAAL